MKVSITNIPPAPYYKMSMSALFSNTHHSLLKYFICVIVLMLISPSVRIQSEYTGGIILCCQTLDCVLPSGRKDVGMKPTNYIANTKYIYILSEGAQVLIMIVCIIISVSRQESGRQNNPKGSTASIS